MKRLLVLYSMLICLLSVCAAADLPEVANITDKPAGLPTTIDRPLIADIQQCFAAIGTSDNDKKYKNTTSFSFHIKVSATDLIFPLAQTNSSWQQGELQIEFTNDATYRAAISINKGKWIQLTWGGEKRKTCPFRSTIINDPIAEDVKPGDIIYIRTEITVPKDGKWGWNVQAREADDKNWTQGATNTDADVLLIDNADFSPQLGLFLHTALGVFGKLTDEKTVVHPCIVVGDSIAPYVYNGAMAVGNLVPVANVSQPAESAERFFRAGQVRQSIFAACDTLLYENGINDIRERKTFEQLKEAALKTWDAFREKGGKRLIVFTLTPLTTSTDNWKTETNQTAVNDPTQKQQWNEFLRKLTPNDVKMDLIIIDTAAVLETTPKSSFWRVLPEGPITDDGVHPNAAGYNLLAKEIGPQIQRALLAEINEFPKKTEPADKPK